MGMTRRKKRHMARKNKRRAKQRAKELLCQLLGEHVFPNRDDRPADVWRDRWKTEFCVRCGQPVFVTMGLQ